MTIREALEKDKTLVAVASNEVDREEMIRDNIPEDRTGVLPCFPLGYVLCMPKREYKKLRRGVDKWLASKSRKT